MMIVNEIVSQSVAEHSQHFPGEAKDIIKQLSKDERVQDYFKEFKDELNSDETGCS